MGKAIDIESLADTVAQYGFAYLITIGDDARIHTSTVNPVIADASLTIPGTSGHARANADKHPNVSLVWPPIEQGGYSLIVDGEARSGGDATGDAADGELSVTPSRAVLHRPASRIGPAPADSTCRSDCVEL